MKRQTQWQIIYFTKKLEEAQVGREFTEDKGFTRRERAGRNLTGLFEVDLV